MYEQVRIEEKAYFYTEKKDWVEKYAREKERLGYKVKMVQAEPRGYIVTSVLWIGYDDSHK